MLDSVSAFSLTMGIRFAIISETCQANMFIENSLGVVRFGLGTGALIKINTGH